MTRSLIAALTLIAACSAATPASAITLDDALRQLTATQPSVDAETLAGRADIEEMRADNSLPGAEIEFSYEWGMHGIGTKLNTGISQSFDWPGVYTARHKAIKEAEQALSAVEQAKRRQRRAQIRDLLVEYIGARRSYAAIAENDSLLGELEAKLNHAYSRGEATVLDVNKLKIARTELSHALHTAASRIDDLKGEISDLAESDSGDILDRLDDFYPPMSIPSEDEYMNAAASASPDMIANSADARSANIAATIEKRSAFPGFSAGYTYSHEQGETFHGFALGLTLPSRSNFKRLAAARLRAESAAQAALGMEASQRARYNALVATAARLDQEIRNLGPVFDACDNIRLLRRAYDGGEISLLDFLQEFSYFCQARQSYIDDQALYYLTLSRLNAYSF